VTTIATALLAAQKALPAIHKDSKAEVPTKAGGKFSYTYLSLQGLLEKVLPVLNANGLALAQMPAFNEQGRQILRTTLYHESGEFIQGDSPLIVSGNETPQAWGGAVTYARRYALTALLGIAADEDDDAAAASRPKVAAKRKEAVAKSANDQEFLNLLGEIDVLADALAIARKTSKLIVIDALTSELPDWRTDAVTATRAKAKLTLWAEKTKAAA